MHCFQGRWHPGTSWTVLRLPFLSNPAIHSVTLTEVEIARLLSCDEAYRWLHKSDVPVWSHYPIWLTSLCMLICFYCMAIFMPLKGCPTVAAPTQQHSYIGLGCAHFRIERWSPVHHCCGALLPLFSDGSTHGLLLDCKSSWRPLPSAPPTGGVFGTKDTATLLWTEDGRL